MEEREGGKVKHAEDEDGGWRADGGRGWHRSPETHGFYSRARTMRGGRVKGGRRRGERERNNAEDNATRFIVLGER